MKKLLEFGRKAMFYVRVLSGYEERRIRSYRLKLQKHLQQVSLPLCISQSVRISFGFLQLSLHYYITIKRVMNLWSVWLHCLYLLALKILIEIFSASLVYWDSNLTVYEFWYLSIVYEFGYLQLGSHWYPTIKRVIIFLVTLFILCVEIIIWQLMNLGIFKWVSKTTQVAT